MADLSGVLAPALTPFDDALEPDVPRFVAHCRSLLANGCDGLAIFGTTSEANSLSLGERERMLEALLESGVDPARLIPGTGCTALPDTVRLTKKAVQAGCSGVLMLPPFYYKNLSEDGIFASYAAVIDRVADARLRVFVYHIPQVSAVPLTVPLIQRLRAAFPQIVIGIKDSSGDWNNTQAVLQNVPNFRVFVGSERFLLRNMRAGGVGCITATANVNAPAIARLYREWQSPDADRIQAEVDKVRTAFESLPLIAAMKAKLGWGAVRPPLVPLSAEQRARVLGAA